MGTYMRTWKTLSRRTILDHSKYLVVEEHAVELTDGRVIPNWPWIITPDYINVAAITDRDEFVCFRQTKYALDGTSLAVVGGYLEPNEDPLAAAQRELLEETGYVAPDWFKFGQFVVDANRGAGTGHLFLARRAYRVAAPDADDLEEQQLLLLSRADVEAALTTGEFKCMAWTAVVALALRHLDRGSAMVEEPALSLSKGRPTEAASGARSRTASILEVMRSRRSIRRYRRDPIPRDTIDQLLEAAALAPSAHNRQPWRFAAITSPDAKERLATAMGTRLRADRIRDGDPPDVIERDVTRSHERIVSAPAAIVVCLSMRDMDRYPDERRASAERTMAVQSVSLAVQNLLLKAHALGLGACWMCAPLFCPDVVREALALPEDWEAQALITLGLPAGAGKPRERQGPQSQAVYYWDTDEH